VRSRRDTRGHAIKTVRDREAPDSNPGPPTNDLNSDLWPCASIRLKFEGLTVFSCAALIVTAAAIATTPVSLAARSMATRLLPSREGEGAIP
jgi:hypothetical protein